jgi:1,4-alpha-glucan branching enzyme
LKGRLGARNVVVSGSFNNWDERELKMKKANDGWILPVYLRAGTYAYKFIVDHEWITDPENPVTRRDASGNINSFMGIGDTLIFRLPGYLQAEHVTLAGSFNNWDGGELLMEKDSIGWFLPYVMAKGLYEYKFIVDGKWIVDIQNPYSAGSGDTENSVIAFQPNHVFELDSFPDAKEVIVTGSFTSWDHGKYRMIRKDGKWIFPAYLSPGKQTYKFIVDGVWMLDPKSELWEQNEYGTNNSLLWIE